MQKNIRLFYLLALLSVCVNVSSQSYVNRKNLKKAIPSASNNQRIVCGQEFSFEIKNGQLWACGRDEFGYLGEGPGNGGTATRIQIGTDDNWVSVALGDQHSIGLKTDGTIWGWGYNASGQVGDGTTIQKDVPVQIGNDNDWVCVGAGLYHSFGIKANGTLWAWGYNQYGTLGDGTTINRTSPVQIGTDNNWSNISGGFWNTLAIKTNGTIWAWGLNEKGELGDGTIIAKHYPVQVGTDNTWIAVTMGSSTCMALKSDGTLWGWGSNAFGCLGNGTTPNYRTTPYQVGTDNKWTRIRMGMGGCFCLATKCDGTLWAWGANHRGQLGDGTTVNKSSPVQVGTDNTWVDIAAGAEFAIAAQADGSTWGWGRNSFGSVGDGTGIDRNTPVFTGSVNKWLSVSGKGHNIGLKSNGTLWSWGNNETGQLGIGNIINKKVPTQIGSASNWVCGAAGDNFSAAIKADGTLWAWGLNASGQIGDGTTTTRLSPVQVGTDNNWISVAPGKDHILALKSNGTLWAWGKNNFGQLGNSAPGGYVNTPLQIGTDQTWVSIAAGAFHSMALKANGTLYVWGGNPTGQLGNGTTTNINAPAQLGTDNNWSTISADASTSFAIKSDGTLWAWGSNNYGQCGDGTTVDKYIPAWVGSNFINAETGEFHTLAVKADGTLWACGRNTYGSLGDATNIDKTSFVQIGSENEWVNVSGGKNHSVVIRTNGYHYCAAGINISGAIGDNTLTNRNIFTCNTNPSGIPSGRSGLSIADQSEEALEDGFFSIYPNPAYQSLNIEYIEEDKEENTIIIYDAIGQKVIELKHTAEASGVGKAIIDLSSESIKAGIYSIMYQTNTKRIGKKFIIVK